MNVTASALESRARRAAHKVDLIAKKSRWRANSIDNLGGFMLIDPYTNGVVAGARFDLTAEDVMERCRETVQ